MEGKICGILPYIDPQVLIKKEYTTASDIYSFGIIMWEILYGVTVSYIGKTSEINLQSLICKGLRPPVNNEATSCYVNLMRECWSEDSKNRPSAEKLCEIFKKWQDDENVILELNKSKIKLENIEKSYADMFSKGSKIYHPTITMADSELQDLFIKE
ncbi:kinase-like domain-containing protein [Gigaspora rosea]|uniref:Kinase-like domain-containing protein n=1 Tax=Gigaspora rosea TaxID=44941 RepID=A0A397VDE3_9GLOM|nr:kinase-like domain-containing protein [Gigaspora rosea]